jgi:hypothetical protein
MNKLLKDLAIEAGFVVTDQFTLDEAKIVKLVELVLEQCANGVERMPYVNRPTAAHYIRMMFID